eukprot:UN27822
MKTLQKLLKKKQKNNVIPKMPPSFNIVNKYGAVEESDCIFEDNITFVDNLTFIDWEFETDKVAAWGKMLDAHIRAEVFSSICEHSVLREIPPRLWRYNDYGEPSLSGLSSTSSTNTPRGCRSKYTFSTSPVALPSPSVHNSRLMNITPSTRSRSHSQSVRKSQQFLGTDMTLERRRSDSISLGFGEDSELKGIVAGDMHPQISRQRRYSHSDNDYGWRNATPKSRVEESLDIQSNNKKRESNEDDEISENEDNLVMTDESSGVSNEGNEILGTRENMMGEHNQKVEAIQIGARIDCKDSAMASVECYELEDKDSPMKSLSGS